MVLFTIIARVADGLPLAATMQDNEQVRNMMKCHLIKFCTLLLQLTLKERITLCIDENLILFVKRKNNLFSKVKFLKQTNERANFYLLNKNCSRLTLYNIPVSVLS